MGRRITSTSDPAWEALFEDFERSAFRLEGHQHYSSPGEAAAFVRFRAGEDPQLDLSYALGNVRAQAAAGRYRARVRIIVEPASDYTRFELAHYPAFVAAGEDVRVIAVHPGQWPAGLPRHDYWLFDDRDAWALAYDPAGAFQSAELVDDPAAIADHLRWRDDALAAAVPLADYLHARTTQRRAS